MASRQRQLVLSATDLDLFNALRSVSPLLTPYDFSDVVAFIEDPSNTGVLSTDGFLIIMRPIVESRNPYRETIRKIRGTKQEVFNAVKAAVPALFGAKVFADVRYFGPSIGGPNTGSTVLDPSAKKIVFNEEVDP